MVAAASCVAAGGGGSRAAVRHARRGVLSSPAPWEAGAPRLLAGTGRMTFTCWSCTAGAACAARSARRSRACLQHAFRSSATAVRQDSVRRQEELTLPFLPLADRGGHRSSRGQAARLLRCRRHRPESAGVFNAGDSTSAVLRRIQVGNQPVPTAQLVPAEIGANNAAAAVGGAVTNTARRRSYPRTFCRATCRSRFIALLENAA